MNFRIRLSSLLAVIVVGAVGASNASAAEYTYHFTYVRNIPAPKTLNAGQVVYSPVRGRITYHSLYRTLSTSRVYIGIINSAGFQCCVKSTTGTFVDWSSGAYNTGVATAWCGAATARTNGQCYIRFV